MASLFTARPPAKYLEPTDVPPENRRTHHISGVAAFVQQLNTPDPSYVPTESWLQKQQREKQRKRELHELELKESIKKWDPNSDLHVRGDPYKTLFVGRLSYNVTEQDLDKEYAKFGPIERIRVVKDPESGKSKGYAFIVFERERDMTAAYKATNGMRIGDRKVVVDVERGRVVKGWKPRRLGGGLGGRHYTKAHLLRSLGAPRKDGFNGRGGDRYRGSRGRGGRDGRDGRDSRDGRDGRDSRDFRGFRDSRDSRDPRDSRDFRDNRRDNRRPPYERRDYDRRDFQDRRERERDYDHRDRDRRRDRMGDRFVRDVRDVSPSRRRY